MDSTGKSSKLIFFSFNDGTARYTSLQALHSHLHLYHRRSSTSCCAASFARAQSADHHEKAAAAPASSHDDLSRQSHLLAERSKKTVNDRELRKIAAHVYGNVLGFGRLCGRILFRREMRNLTLSGIDLYSSGSMVVKEDKKLLTVLFSNGHNGRGFTLRKILRQAADVDDVECRIREYEQGICSDIFDVEHFKRTLQADVRVVSSLPSTYFMSRQTIMNKIPHNVTP